MDDRLVKARAARWVNKPTMEERFWAKVNKDGPIHPRLGQCWVWTGSINARGYPQLFASRKTPGGHPFSDVAHRVSYRMHHGEIPEGMYVDHMCQRRSCVNPAHLRVVTPYISAIENNDSPFAEAAKRTHCPKCGNPYSGANLAMYTRPTQKTRHGHPRKPKPARVCLTCNPNYWRHAVIPREPPPGARKSRRVQP